MDGSHGKLANSTNSGIAHATHYKHKQAERALRMRTKDEIEEELQEVVMAALFCVTYDAFNGLTGDIAKFKRLRTKGRVLMKELRELDATRPTTN